MDQILDCQHTSEKLKLINNHPSALPHLYHSAWQKIAKDPYTMNFTLETLNLT